MSDLEKIELAIRRAASQMPNHQSRAFRLVADEIALVNTDPLGQDNNTTLSTYRVMQRSLD